VNNNSDDLEELPSEAPSEGNDDTYDKKIPEKVKI
jgi:hypothetical protein